MSAASKFTGYTCVDKQHHIDDFILLLALLLTTVRHAGRGIRGVFDIFTELDVHGMADRTIPGGLEALDYSEDKLW